MTDSEKLLQALVADLYEALSRYVGAYGPCYDIEPLDTLLARARALDVQV